MKRCVLMATLVGILVMATAAVWADPINVGGNFTAALSTSRGPAVYPGKGDPQGVPFNSAESYALLSPINVGGN
jgi:hypothetical protein